MMEWRFVRFGLIVTGHTEARCLPDLFRIMAATGTCNFQVIRKVGQRSPRSPERQLQMVGRGKKIPDKDANEIGFPARSFLACKDSYVLLVDDLEADRSGQRQQIFDRYRSALDTILDARQANRSSVHFLVNMLEAYFFGDSDAVNSVLGTNLDDYGGDVETIRNPKAETGNRCPEYNVIEDGCKILGRLDVTRILSRPDACASLRTMFAWVYRAIGEPESEVRPLLDGGYDDVTKVQILALPA